MNPMNPSSHGQKQRQRSNLSMPEFMSEGYEVLETRDVDGTLVIGVAFIFLAYFLHPAVEFAYHKVRAYRAWRAIEMRRAVEVTNYSMFAEIFGGRGRWDGARIITALLAVFSLASWGLELSVDLARHEGSTDLLNQPPPVEIRQKNDVQVWQVKSRDELGYDGNWMNLPNLNKEQAKSRYYVESRKFSGNVSGDIVVAYWRNKSDDTLFYYNGDDIATTLTNLYCTDGDGHQDVKNVHNGGNETAWGSVYSCDKGPSMTNNLTGLPVTKSDPPPTIVMIGESKVFLVVEESSTSPSFLYSVWVVGNQSAFSTELNHVFHIAATMRLAEAVVTGIVHGETSGGGCFGLLRSFSERRVPYNSTVRRALPFGECPNGDSTAKIEDTETIVYGLKIGIEALLCIVWVMLLTSIGVAWSICLRSSIGMDIYDRDELIRAVSLQGVAPGGTPSSEIRMFVRREDTGNISVVISDTGKAHGTCARLFRKGGNVVKDIEPVPVAATANQYNHGFGGADVPVGPRTVWLEGVRTGRGRPIPGPDGNYRYPTSVALSASPVPSNAASLVVTPISSPARRGNSFVPRGGGRVPAGRGPSAMFDSVYSLGDIGDGSPNGMQAVDSNINSPTASEGVSGELRAWRPEAGIAVSQATASDIEMSKQSSGGKTPERWSLTRGIPHMGTFSQGSEEDTEESRCSSIHLEIESPEHSPSSQGGAVGDE